MGGQRRRESHTHSSGCPAGRLKVEPHGSVTRNDSMWKPVLRPKLERPPAHADVYIVGRMIPSLLLLFSHVHSSLATRLVNMMGGRLGAQREMQGEWF